ncbi:MAG: ribonuclease P protein component, partial [Patescibacteria group bacterium]
FVLLYRENKKDKSRFGFVTSTKFDKRATKRNRARRLLREAVRQQLSDIASGYDMMFIARAPLKEAGFEEVSSSLDKVLSKVSLL